MVTLTDVCQGLLTDGAGSLGLRAARPTSLQPAIHAFHDEPMRTRMTSAAVPLKYVVR